MAVNYAVAVNKKDLALLSSDMPRFQESEFYCIQVIL